MEFLFYQCCEDKADDSPLHKALKRITYEIALKLVQRSHAYTAAPWGCDESNTNRGAISLLRMARGQA